MFRKLRADEIECRVSTINDRGLSLLLYKDARCDMNILDETVGALNWQRSHSRENANCTVSIWDKDKCAWVSKEDTGTESYTEKEKGLASDSFKRACVNWGIGRELYTAPFIWISAGGCNIKTGKNGKPACYDRFRVTRIGYDGAGTISALEIVNAKTGKVVFASGDALTGRADTNRSRLIRACDKIGQTLDDVAREYGLNRDSTEEEFGIVLNKIMERFGNGRQKRI